VTRADCPGKLSQGFSQANYDFRFCFSSLQLHMILFVENMIPLKSVKQKLLLFYSRHITKELDFKEMLFF